MNLLTPPMRRAARYVARAAVGIARDFWKDGNWNEVQDKPVAAGIAPVAAPSGKGSRDLRQVAIGPDGLWKAEPGELSERMWGVDCILPADAYFAERLLQPFGLTKNMSLLDLSSGIGLRPRKAVGDYGVSVTALEQVTALAARGTEISVAAGFGNRAAVAPYNPANLEMGRTYDCILFREAIYRAADPGKFAASVVACCNPQAQISFTDYIVNDDVRGAPAIAAWHALEPTANPVGLAQMAELWAGAGILLKVSEDQTEPYKKEVMMGLARFAKFMAAGIKPDPNTRKAIDWQVKTWAHRMAAIEAGMRLYRFYGVR